jgi:hypothetical protein
MAFASWLPWLKGSRGHTGRTQRGSFRKSIAYRKRFVPRLDILEDRTVPSTLVVNTTLDEVDGGTVGNPAGPDGLLSLREAILVANTDASNGQSDTISFAGSLGRATITLDPTLGQLELSGVPPQGTTATETINGRGLITVSGNDATRVFQVDAGVTAIFTGLKITQGLALNGGGILNFGTLTLSHDVISDNQAVGAKGQSAFGGGIANGTTTVGGATVTISDSLFSNNQAVGGDGDATTASGGGNGGAIANIGSHLILTDSIFTGNLAQAGNGGVGSSSPTGVTNVGNASGGAIRTAGPTGDATITDSVFINNQAIGGSRNTGGRGRLTPVGSSLGGAIVAIGNGPLKLSDSVFIGNLARGGTDNSGGSPTRNLVGLAVGGALVVSVSPGNRDTGLGTIDNCGFINNQAVGGAGSLIGSGNPNSLTNIIGAGAGGAIAAVDGGKPTVTNSKFFYNQAVGGAGGDGGNGGDGLGGAIGAVALGPPTDFNGSLTMSNDTLFFNQAIGGARGDGVKGGNGLGGGVYSDAGSTDINGTIFDTKISTSRIIGNKAIGVDGGDGKGGGFYNASSMAATLTDTIIIGNHASTSNPNIYGPVTIDPGADLIDALMSLLGNKDKQES